MLGAHMIYSRGFKYKLFLILFLLYSSACSPLMNVGHYDDHHDSLRDGSFLLDQNCPLEFKKLDLCAELVWDQTSIRSNVLNSMQLRFWRKSGLGRPSDSSSFELDSSLRPSVWLWMDMSEGGHSSSPVRLSQLGSSSGEYAVDEVVFSMRGKWKIHVDLVDSAQQVLDQSFMPIWIGK